MNVPVSRAYYVSIIWMATSLASAVLGSMGSLRVACLSAKFGHTLEFNGRVAPLVVSGNADKALLLVCVVSNCRGTLVVVDVP